MQKKKKSGSKKKIIRFLVLFAIVLVFMLIGYNLFNKKEKVKQVIKIEETIDDYGYELADNETQYYKDLFKELKGVLKETEVDEEKYASLVSRLFLADFFNLDNKVSKNDIGGVQFIYDSFREDFEKLAKESIYHYVESNIYGDRKQQLPIVREVSVLDIKDASYTYLEESDDNAYQIDLKIVYEEDLGYQENVTLVLAHHNGRLEIIKMMEE